MNENQLAESMRAAVADEPPLGFDPDELTDRAARGSASAARCSAPRRQLSWSPPPRSWPGR